MAYKKLLGCLFITLVLTGCATAHKVETVKGEIVERTWLSFLETGETTKAEVLSGLGEPSAQFEEGRIFTYRLDAKYHVVPSKLVEILDDDPIAGYVPVWQRVSDYDRHVYGGRLSVWDRTRYSLVLVFDEAGILQRRSLVRVR